MEYAQIFWLSAVQGLSEFLPVSSSGHLVLLPWLLGWPDQGLSFDVAVHLGSLLAVLVYFRRLIVRIVRDCLASLCGAGATEYSRLGWLLALASVMMVPAGVLLGDWRGLRQAVPIAVATMAFGLLLGLADWFGRQHRPLASLTRRDAVWIGLGQILAIIPGTSRAGITITVGLMLGLTRTAAARFSFLLSIPVILMATGWKTQTLLEQGQAVDWAMLWFAVVSSAGFAGLCIHWFLALVQRCGMWPFVVYRLLLGGWILWSL